MINFYWFNWTQSEVDSVSTYNNYRSIMSTLLTPCPFFWQRGSGVSILYDRGSKFYSGNEQDDFVLHRQ